ncbi:MAG: SH3 domain-containing protein [Anaerolineaceae bacterium]|nr:SH3 domain-containing protein [Anaerolineaceae bacterium]
MKMNASRYGTTIRVTQRIVIAAVLVMLMVTMTTTSAQDETCDTGTLSETLIDYAQQIDQGDYDTIVNVTSEINMLLRQYVDTCNPEEAVSNPDAPFSDFTVGKYRLTWRQETDQTQCGTSATNRNAILLVADDGRSVQVFDAWVYDPLAFELQADGQIIARRNLTLTDGSTLTYEYILDNEAITTDSLQGTITTFLPSYNCYSTESFTYTLIDANQSCLVAAPSRANMRSGPGTNYQQAGIITSDEQFDVIGQATGTDGFVWWKLENNAWIRSDLVKEAGLCDDVEVVEP